MDEYNEYNEPDNQRKIQIEDLSRKIQFYRKMLMTLSLLVILTAAGTGLYLYITTPHQMRGLPRDYIHPNVLNVLIWSKLDKDRRLWATKILNKKKIQCGNTDITIAQCIQFETISCPHTFWKCHPSDALKKKVDEIFDDVSNAKSYKILKEKYLPKQ